MNAQLSKNSRPAVPALEPASGGAEEKYMKGALTPTPCLLQKGTQRAANSAAWRRA
jgi:hypothetical protein